MDPVLEPIHTEQMANVHKAIGGFAPITLAEMDAVKLMNRVDRKYVFHISALPTILAELSDTYRSLEVEGERVSPYLTMYFDTEDLGMYRDHHNGKPNRTKVRYRHYLQNGAVFFEVKRKIRGLRTDKVRIPMTAIPDRVDAAETALLNRFNIAATGLRPTMEVRYGRLTLVCNDRGERVTIDLGLTFADSERTIALNNVVIAEVKTDSITGKSQMNDLMRRLVIRPMGMSKYSAAVAMLNSGAKTNAFKGKLRKILNINNQNEPSAVPC